MHHLSMVGVLIGVIVDKFTSSVSGTRLVARDLQAFLGLSGSGLFRSVSGPLMALISKGGQPRLLGPTHQGSLFFQKNDLNRWG